MTASGPAHPAGRAPSRPRRLTWCIRAAPPRASRRCGGETWWGPRSRGPHPREPPAVTSFQLCKNRGLGSLVYRECGGVSVGLCRAPTPAPGSEGREREGGPCCGPRSGPPSHRGVETGRLYVFREYLSAGYGWDAKMAPQLTS